MNGMVRALVIILLAPIIIVAVIFVVFLIRVGVEHITPDRELQVVLNVVFNGLLLYILNRKLGQNPRCDVYLVDMDFPPDDEQLDEEEFLEEEDNGEDATPRSE